jgi:hypothetical protein
LPLAILIYHCLTAPYAAVSFVWPAVPLSSICGVPLTVPFVPPANVSSTTGAPPAVSFIASPAVTDVTAVHFTDPEFGSLGVLQSETGLPVMLVFTSAGLPFTVSLASLLVCAFPSPCPHFTLLAVVNTPAIAFVFRLSSRLLS